MSKCISWYNWFLINSKKYGADRIDVFPYAIVTKNQYLLEFRKNIKEENCGPNEAQGNDDSHGCHVESFYQDRNEDMFKTIKKW